ncbi:hypothetical protein N8I77_013391 [Diaporthe amygdali]|uniref:Polyketide synthase n=1 Tax=Phomopsis amygdali TaxID=1214568 RepID=A0AAD9S1B7_PHOAM|nr:hypothetical protein N8I77_013391 [Diaporthe amygdali]
MGCRLPGDVSSPAGFWDLMMSKRSGQTPKVPASRFNIDAHYHKNNDRPGSFGVLGGYFLSEAEDLASFDPGLFGITPIEAMWMDPQQRKLLEVVYEALESGGITLDAISGTRTAVFAASFTADWQQMSFKEASFRHSLTATGVDPGIISNRISHVFNLNGPSIMVNTACSSSVYALHNACNALRNSECEGAIVGGVNLIITVDQHMNTAKLGVLSPTSTCHTFDEEADGYGRADAVGAVYLKRLSDAVRDGDPIRGVIRSSAVNSNGKVPAVGITHPNRDGQADVISHAYRRGGDLDPRLTGYFECHGTGTAIGDPLEVHAVSMAMNKSRQPGEDPLIIGAVKTNIGHSEAASGLSALIKAILVVERGIIPPIKGLQKLNPKIKWDEWQVKVPTEPTPFPSHLPVRRVSINSFGYGGTNAHVVVEATTGLVQGRQAAYAFNDPHDRYAEGRKALVPRRAAQRKRPFLLPFSAHDKPTLLRNIEAHGKVAADYRLLDLSWTLSTRRSKLSSRAYTVASYESLESAFGDETRAPFAFADTKKSSSSSAPRTIGFVFTGQGSQWARMGAELIEYSAVFLRAIRGLDQALEELSDGPAWSLEDMLLAPGETSRVQEAEFAQPLCTAVQVALVQLLQQWGVRPAATVGHSSGEIGAAYAAGLLSARDAITLAYYRGLVTRDAVSKGAMLAVGLGAEAVMPYVEAQNAASAKLTGEEQAVQGKVVVACHNSPMGVTLSGDADAVYNVQQKLVADGVFARAVKTGGKAYHSHHMAPLSATYEAHVRAAKAARKSATMTKLTRTSLDLPLATSAKMVSSVTNSVVPSDSILDETYWSANLRSPVLFNQAVQTMLKTTSTASNGSGTESGPLGNTKVDLLIEIGPHSAMSGPIKQIRTELQRGDVDYIPTLIRGADSAAQMLRLAGELFLRNYPVDMEQVATAYAEGPGAVIVDLPPYQWNYARPMWAESRASREQRLPQFPRHDVLGQLVIGSSLAEPTWRNVLRSRDLPWTKDHFLGGENVFPAAGYFAMAMEAITQLREMGRLAGTDASSSSLDGSGGIESYVLRDVSIDKALIVPDDDDGIEVLFNARPSVAAGSGWWEFSVSSIDTSGVVKEHMTGSVGINRRPSKGKDSLIREVPEFTQRASGRAWNQALRDVGFDYGPTFQDMDDIRFDGRRHEASCATALKQTVDAALGESRYVLHPASVDSVLQLSIAAIYAGRTGAMDCGVIPVRFAEVAVWPPSNAQLQGGGAATAYAWSDRHGIRSFETGAQMVAADGGLVLEIKGLRTVKYEAAVPQRPASALEEAPFGEMTWELDIDSLSESAQLEGMDSLDLLRLALFKNPSAKVLLLTAAGEDDLVELKNKVLRENRRAFCTVTVGSDKEVEAAKESLAEFQNIKVVKMDEGALAEDPSGKANLPFAVASFDLVVTGDKIQSPHDLHRFLKPLGRVIGSSASATNGHHPNGEATISATIKNSAGVYTTKYSTEEDQERKATPPDHEIQIVYRSHQTDIVPLLSSALESMGWRVSLCSLDECTRAGVAKQVIMLADLEAPLLHTMTEKEFAQVQDITSTASYLVWVSTGGLLEGKRPEHALVSGLARALAAERASLLFSTLDVDPDSTTPQQVVESILAIARGQVHAEEEQAQGFSPSPDREFCLSGGRTYISRLVPRRDLNSVFTTTSAEAQDSSGISSGSGEHLVAKVVKGKVQFCQDEQRAAVAPGFIEVRVQATGLTDEGVMVISGQDYPKTFSHEIGGVVTRVGAGVAGFREGDAVVGLHADCFASHQHVHEDMLQKLQGGRASIVETTSALMAFASALYGLDTLARVTKGDDVLVLHGTGFSGAAAIQIARLRGAVPYASVRTDAEASFLGDKLGLPPAQILRTPEGVAVSEQIKRLTNGKGADVVFSAGGRVSADDAREAWRSIARFGRFLDGGRKGGSSLQHQNGPLDASPVQRGACYLAYDVLDLLEARPVAVAGLLATTVSLLGDGSIVLPPGELQAVGLGEVDRAVARAFSSEALDFGASKFVLDYEKGAPTSVLPARPRLGFSPDATYLLVGCLGGLGRSLTSWMMESGARRFTFLSRSGADAPSAARLVAKLEEAGAAVQVVRGDAGSLEDVKRAVNGIPAEHPVKGVIHAAMVLRDGLFESMTFENWKASVTPKVTGAANLDAALADTPLDFFLMTSSVSGILGTPAQGNYAAANSYLDALARHRRAQGRAAVSAVLPMVLGVGVVAENSELEQSLRRKGMYGIDEVHLLEGFEAAIASSSASPSSPHRIVDSPPDHVVVGLDASKLQGAVNDPVATDSFWLQDARFSHAAHDINASSGEGGGDGSGGGGSSAQSILATMKAAASPAEAVACASSHLADKLARMLMLDAGEFDEPDARSIAAYGIDSMIGAELRGWIFREFRLDIPFQQLLAPTLTLTKFARQVCESQGIEGA